MHEIDIMDIGGFKIGQAEDTKGLTGCTAVSYTHLTLPTSDLV